MRILFLTITILALSSLPAFGEETKTFTDEDLEKYSGPSAYDEETISRGEADLKKWEKDRASREKQETEARDKDARKVTEKNRTSSSAKESAFSQNAAKASDGPKSQAIRKKKT